MSQKRNRLSVDRGKLLSNPNVVYSIRCTGSLCECDHFGLMCRRGFFSLWIQAVYGKYFASGLNIPSYVDFGDKPYLYSDPDQFAGEMNFWNYYYEQQPIQANERKIPNELIETYPLRIWHRSHLKQVYQRAISCLKLKKAVRSHIDTLLAPIRESRTLGVHIRGTDHSNEVPEVPLDRYLKILDRKQHRFDKIFIATDDRRVLETLKNKYTHERIICQHAVRSSDHQAVHTNMLHRDRYRLGLEVLADCYALSTCQETVLVHSNVSYSALLLNPGLKYTLLETMISRNKRLKTGFLYQLDRWGIRKM